LALLVSSASSIALNAADEPLAVLLALSRQSLPAPQAKLATLEKEARREKPDHLTL